MSLFLDFTARYRPSEAWVYDRCIAPAITGWYDRLYSEMAPMVPAGAKVLDVGCGGGQLLAFLASRDPSLALTGVDRAPSQVARARERLHAAGSSAEILEGDALALPFAEGRFDAVVSVASIKHWPDPVRGLAELHRVTRPGGWLFVLEGDRGARLQESRAFIAGTRLPRPIQRAFLPVFRTWVLGQAFDLDDFRALAAPLDLASLRVERIPGLPAVVLRGQRTAPLPA